MLANTEETLKCRECGCSMYQLPGSIQSIYVCSKCGFSIDEVEFKEYETASHKCSDEQIDIKNLLNNQFMKKYTRFPDLGTFIENCKFFISNRSVSPCEMLSNIPKRKLDLYIKQNTCFQSWNEMFEKAVGVYLKL